MAPSVPPSIRKAVAIPAHDRTRSIGDVSHVIVLMQENRSFDHYFGTLRGVRGFADPHPISLPTGQSVWHQPDGAGGEVLPFRPTVADMGMTFLPDPPHGWIDTSATPTTSGLGFPTRRRTSRRTPTSTPTSRWSPR
jgi:phospholipase C